MEIWSFGVGRREAFKATSLCSLHQVEQSPPDIYNSDIRLSAASRC